MVVDTNVFVAAGFNEGSASARILESARAGEFAIRWNQRTRGETQRILSQIPPLSWSRVAALFLPELEITAPLDTGPFDFVKGEVDREFVALADASNSTLVSSDDDLLGPRSRLPVRVFSPSEFLSWWLR
ncbi:MAG: hypothetical protein GKS06_09565 [Acidobacteria bacterium]|nr:hypothetical protein [Acidobacteriota bacterium]